MAAFIKTFAFLAICLITFALSHSWAFAGEPLPDTLIKVKPGIVAVGTFLPSRSPRGVFLGTGFAVSNGSIIVTNAHVLPEQLDDRRLEKIAVFYHKNGQDKFTIAQQVSLDRDHDLALLKISGDTLPPLRLGSIATVREGQLFAFTGFPIGMVLGLRPVTHRGILSAITPNIIPSINPGKLNSKLIQQMKKPFDVFQLDATAYPGNSGSPLYNPSTGEVIGIINKVFIEGSKENALSHPSGITYAIPANHIKNLLIANKIN